MSQDSSGDKNDFDIRKAAQIVAFFIIKEGKPICKKKGYYLMYLAQRLYLEKYDRLLLYDDFFVP